MDNQQPIFGKTDQLSDPQLRDVYPHKVSKISYYNFIRNKSKLLIRVMCRTLDIVEHMLD